MVTTRTAQLITPQGQTLSLPPEMYEVVLEMLKEWKDIPETKQTDLLTLIEETRGKYAGGASLVDALLCERAAERERETKRDRARTERFFRTQ